MIRQQIHAAVPRGGWTKHFGIIPRKNASIFLSADLIAEGYYLPQTLHALARARMHTHPRKRYQKYPIPCEAMK